MAIGRTIIVAAGSVLRGAADLLLPSVCLACGQADAVIDGLCESCARKLLDLVARPYCARCGSSLSAGASARADGCYACPSVLPRFKRVLRLGPYEQPLGGLIRQLKYRRQDVVRNYLSRLLAEAFAGQCPDERPDVVLAIPAHWRRRFARSYDHAGALAGALAHRLGLPLGNELTRIRHTPPQTHLPRTGRIENVRGAFVAKPSKAITGAHVLLVDDVTSTGATANEAARTILSAGASAVTLAVVAKADPPAAYTKGQI